MSIVSAGNVDVHRNVVLPIERSRNFACFCAFRHLFFENHSIFGDNLNRISYSYGLLIVFLQIL